MRGTLKATAGAALALALAAASVDAMPLQYRDQAPAFGARRSNTYFGPGEGSRGGDLRRASEPAPSEAWRVDQEVMRTRSGGTEFVLRMENISSFDALVFSDGSTQAAGMSHGVYSVHPDGWPVYEPGEITLSATGLEELAEDGNVRPMQAYLEKHPDVVESGIFYKPVGWDKDGELWPGDAYEFRFTADPGDKLSFATMLMQSNDIIYGPREGRMELFTADGRPISGDISGEIAPFDAGTEVNEDPLFGANVGVNQRWLNAGDPEEKEVRPPDDGFAYPAASKVLRVTLGPAR
jgi:hypothetical protein